MFSADSVSAPVTIRTATPADAAALLSIYRPYVEHTAITFEYEVPTVEEFAGRIEQILKKYPYLVAESVSCDESGNVSDTEILGYAYVGTFHDRPAYDWAVETSIYVNREKKRMGIGGRLYAAMESILKEQGILNLYACIACPEDDHDEYLTRDSIRFHKRLGYRMVGEFRQCGYKFGRWYHMVWMEKFIGEHLDEQPPVKTFAEVQKNLDFDS